MTAGVMLFRRANLFTIGWVAGDPSLKGKGNENQCLDYALALSSWLAANGNRNTEIEGSQVL
jgi:hypothetical protein